nr:hypothetical protein [Tanacetum cinerariifolium]
EVSVGSTVPSGRRSGLGLGARRAVEAACQAVGGCDGLVEVGGAPAKQQVFAKQVAVGLGRGAVADGGARAFVYHAAVVGGVVEGQGFENVPAQVVHPVYVERLVEHARIHGHRQGAGLQHALQKPLVVAPVEVHAERKARGQR